MYRLAKITLVLLAACIAACIAGFVLISAWNILFETVFVGVPALVLFSKLKKAEAGGGSVKAGDVVGAWIIAGLTMFVTFTSAPIGIGSGSVWKYPFQRAYLGRFIKDDAAELFPERLEDVQGDYELRFMPTIMQGGGFMSLCYRTSPERAAAVEDRYAPGAVHTIPLDEYGGSGSFYRVEGFEPNGSKDGTVTVGISGVMEREHSGGAVIYVLYSNYDWNHQRSRAVIVDKETGLVQYWEE